MVFRKPKDTPRLRTPDRMSDSAFLSMAGVEWPADLEEISFSVPADDAAADLFLPGMSPDAPPAGSADDLAALTNRYRQASAGGRAPALTGAALNLTRALRAYGMDPPDDVLRAAGLAVDPSRFAEVERDDALLSRIGMGEFEEGAADLTAPENAALDFVAMTEAPFAEALLPIDMTAVEIMDYQPMDGSNAVKRKVRKHLLPMGRIQHSGRVLNFTKEVLENIARHSLSAFDQIPITVATEKNEHNEDPFRFAGEVENFTVVADGPPEKRGLYADMALNQKGAELLDLNPKLGTSPRFLPNYVRQADARRFGAVVRHVCATLDPFISGLGRWAAGRDGAGTAAAGVALTAMPPTAGGGAVTDLTRAPWMQPAADQADPNHAHRDPSNQSKGGTHQVAATDRTNTHHDFTEEVTRQMDPTKDTPTDPVAIAATQAEEALQNFDFSQLTGDQLKDIVLGLQTDLSVTRNAAAQDAETVQALTTSLAEKDIDLELKDFARRGVKRSILYKAKGLLMSPAASQEVAVVDFAAATDGQAPAARQTALGSLVREILTDCQGQVDMTGVSGERGSLAATATVGTPYQAARQRHETDYQEVLARIGRVAPDAVAPATDGQGG